MWSCYLGPETCQQYDTWSVETKSRVSVRPRLTRRECAYDSGRVEAWLPTEQQSSPAPCLASHCQRGLGPGPTSVWSQAGPRGHALKHSRHNTRAPPHIGVTSCIQLHCLRSSSVSRLSAVSVQSVSSVSQSVRQVSPSSPDLSVPMPFMWRAAFANALCTLVLANGPRT